MMQLIKDFFNRDKRRMKRKFQTACKHSGLMQIYKSGSKQYRVYPTIIEQDYSKEKIEIRFIIRNGMEVNSEKFILFCQQSFNCKVVLLKQINIKTFLLTILQRDLEKNIHYNYQDYEKSIKTKRVPVLVGYNHQRKLIVFDMKQSPHMLVSGTSGGGKSSLLRAIIMSMIQSAKDIDLYLSDFKMSELLLYKPIAKGVAVNNQQLQVLLSRICKELDNRSRLLEAYGVLHTDNLPAKVRPNVIVVVIDELLLLEGHKENLKYIERISAIGRALNCYLLLACQRFESKVISGFIKNNINLVVSFKTANEISSRLNGISGAEQLSVKGRCLISVNGSVEEVQVPFISANQVKKLLKDYITQQIEQPQPVQENPYNQLTLTERPTTEENRLENILEGNEW
ncbi:FtsK/SpoIIIE domain-containing protein [Schinkia azotoformans]|uniref:FtsK/SpoIIIE domain-containing protein n=1 Tax=Schinkia azotoformans TaxID=1454 RepID=UPI002E22F276|nr:FtsK/SpoIIIE domain-containing protein [Schinkia azotoformans]MED4353717.1 FtsK/SpoIIIE domain-containing protein [Schinkia azotoformans]